MAIIAALSVVYPNFGMKMFQPYFFGMGTERVAQPVVGRHSSCHGHLLDTRVFHNFAELVHKNVDNGLFQRCGKVGLVMFHKVGIFFHPFTQRIKKRGFQTAEAIVIAPVCAVC